MSAVDVAARLEELATRIVIAQEACNAAAPLEGVRYNEERECIFRGISGYHDGLCDAWWLLTKGRPPAKQPDGVLDPSLTSDCLLPMLREGEKTAQQLAEALGCERQHIGHFIAKLRRDGHFIGTRRVRRHATGADNTVYWLAGAAS